MPNTAAQVEPQSGVSERALRGVTLVHFVGQPRPNTWVLQVFALDGQTVLVEIGTSPDHPHPFLDTPRQSSGSSVDYLQGRSKIGQTNVRILDRERVLGDQDSGFFTQLLASWRGFNGHRARLLYSADGESWEVVNDGPFSTPELEDTFVTFHGSILDENERASQVRAFDKTGTTTLLPRGVLDGYGLLLDSPGRDSVLSPALKKWLVSPSRPVRARVFETELSPHVRVRRAVLYKPGTSELMSSVGSLGSTPEDFVYPAFYDQACLASPAESDPGRFEYPNVEVRWRVVGEAAWNSVTPADNRAPLAPAVIPVNVFTTGTRNLIRKTSSGIRVKTEERVRAITGVFLVDGNPDHSLPAVGAELEVLVVYTGPASEQFPFHYEGTEGDYLSRAYRGDFSAEPVPTRVDQRAMDGLTTPMRVRITEPVDDLRKYLESEVYQPRLMAPTLDPDGAISPTRHVIPDESEPLAAVLTDNDCKPVANWSHGDANARNLAEFVYYRDMHVPVSDDPLAEVGAADTVVAREITVRRLGSQESRLKFGVRPQRVKTQAYRSLGNADGAPMNGEHTDEVGHQLGASYTRTIISLFQYGAQTYPVLALRSSVAGVRQGAFVGVQLSWLPDYATGRRGMNRIAQVVGVRSEDPLWVRLYLLDAGDDAQPLARPGAAQSVVEVDGAARVTYNEGLVSGAEGLGVEFAVTPSGTATYPEYTSGLWTPLGELPAGVGSLTTQPLPAGSMVWVRAQWRAEDRRPSLWTHGGFLSVSSTPRILRAGLSIPLETGSPEFFAEVNPYVTHVRLYFEEHAPELAPVPAVSFVDVAVEDLPHTFSSPVFPGRSFTVRPVPYAGLPTGGGVAGPEYALLTAARSTAVFTSFSQEEVSSTQRRVTLTSVPGGATLHYRTNGGPWTTVVTSAESPSVSFALAVQGEVLLEYYSELGADVEFPIKSIVLDSGSQGNLRGLTLSEPRPGVLRADALLDDDMVEVEFFARLGARPVLTNEDPDPLMRKARRPREVPYFESGVSLGMWYVLARARDGAGFHTQMEGNIQVLGVGDASPVLRNLGVALVQVGPDWNHQVTWDHSAAVTAAHLVRVEEAGVEVLGAADARSATRDADDTDPGVALHGGWRRAVRPPADPSDPNAVFLTWPYEVTLLTAGGADLFGPLAKSISGWYARDSVLGSPTESPANLHIANADEEGGIGGPEVRGWWTNTSPAWALEVEWYRADDAFDPVWVLYATHSLPSGRAFDSVDGLVTGNGVYYKIRYTNSTGPGPWAVSGESTVGDAL